MGHTGTLDEFASAYIDYVLVFTTGSLSKHREHVSMVLDRLSKARLHLDIDKCELEVKSTKYPGFIIEAGKGVSGRSQSNYGMTSAYNFSRSVRVSRIRKLPSTVHQELFQSGSAAYGAYAQESMFYLVSRC